MTVKTVPAEVAGAGTNEMTAEFEPAPLTATAVTCDGAGGAAGAGGAIVIATDPADGVDVPAELLAVTLKV